MRKWLDQHGIDRRFIELTAFMMAGTWVCLLGLTVGLAVVGWRIILIHQAIAWPFALVGWAAGFRLAQGVGKGQRTSAMVAGWLALITAEIGTALVINIWSGTGGALGGMIVFPILAVLVTIGVLWLYRQDTRPAKGSGPAGRAEA